MKLQGFLSESRIINSWNNTISRKAIVIYPESVSRLIYLIKLFKKSKKKFLIRTGSCSYDSKSINPDYETYVLSLKKLNKIIKINIKKKTIEVQAGAMISEVIKKIKDRNVTLYSVPGGENISVGGAISANTIGKDSSPKFSSFGDAIISLDILTNDGKIKKIEGKKIDLNKYIGAFGMAGLILNAKLRLKKIKSQNVLFTTKILKNINAVEHELNKKADYQYIQLDPFFRGEHFAIAFRGTSINIKKKNYKKVNLKIFKFERFIFKFFGFFINNFTWKIFYKLFFLFNKEINKVIDLHNFHYGSKYKHLIPLTCKDGLLDYEILIQKNFKNYLQNIISFLKYNKIYPMYIIIKKIYKSKKRFNYQFNNNGYAVAISINKSLLSNDTLKSFQTYLKKKKFKINLSKTDEKFINHKENKNYLFLSLYKKMILKQYGLSRTRA